MLAVPSREIFASLERIATTVAPTAIVGLARTRSDARVEVLYSDSWGLGGYVEDAGDLPAGIVAGSGAPRIAAVTSSPVDAVARQLGHAGASFLAGVDLPDGAAPTRLWFGLRETPASTPDWGRLASDAAALLAAGPPGT